MVRIRGIEWHGQVALAWLYDDTQIKEEEPKKLIVNCSTGELLYNEYDEHNVYVDKVVRALCDAYRRGEKIKQWVCMWY